MPPPAQTSTPSHPAPRSSPALRLLAADRRRGTADLPARVTIDRARRGAVAVRAPGGAVRRAEPSPWGPLVLEVRPDAGGLVLEVWGPPATPPEAAGRALAAAAAWAGLDDDVNGFARLVEPHPVLRVLHRRLGAPRLSRLPRTGEAVGRAVVAQLVQTVEARRSTAQVAALVGDPAGGGLWTWPTADRLARTPAWQLRRCGVSLRGAQALHAASMVDARLSAAAPDWGSLDRRLRALPGVGAWTSAETRLALGDPDAVSVGDYHLPALVGSLLSRGTGNGHDGAWTDADMLALLAPYEGQRGRVVRLLIGGSAAGLVRRPARRASRAALSRHRYW